MKIRIVQNVHTCAFSNSLVHFSRLHASTFMSPVYTRTFKDVIFPITSACCRASALVCVKNTESLPPLEIGLKVYQIELHKLNGNAEENCLLTFPMI